MSGDLASALQDLCYCGNSTCRYCGYARRAREMQAEIVRLRAENAEQAQGWRAERDAERWAVRAEMARRGLLHTQLSPYEDPDTERFIIPREESDSIAAAWEFLTWLDRQTEARRER